MRKLFTSNLILLLLLNVAVKPLWIFGIDRTVQNVLGANEYGFYYVLFNFTLIFNILLDLGITNYNNREISRHPQLINRYFSGIVSLKAMLGIVYLVVVTFSAYFLGYGKHHTVLLLLLVGNQFLSSMVLFVRSNLNGLHKFKVDSILSVLDKFTMIIIVSVFLYTNLSRFFTIKTFVIAQSVSYLFTLAVSIFFLLFYTPALKFKFRLKFSFNTLKRSLPYALLVLLMSIYGRIDTVAVERLMSDGFTNAGIYAQAFRLLDAFNMFPFLFASLLLPIFSRMIKNKEDVVPFLGYSFLILIIPTVAIAIPTIGYSQNIMDLLYREHPEISAKVLSILMGSFMLITVNYVFGTLLTAKGNIAMLNVFSGIAAATSIVVQLIFVPKFGILGAALGNLLVNALVAIMQTAYACKVFELKVSAMFIFKFVAFFVGTVLLFLLSKYFNTSWFVKFFALIGASTLLALLLRLINLKYFLPFLSKD
ncbi:MAG: oligosaccharide flippase family protein [Bacteroidales bacterium]|nr:oligosaccharide flippase family protein [Bacteroidales bacterium]HPD96419.1 oligosaccharide flippase family protein [Tenuifilaceae bacterium]HRX32387.1 oligosaccharide flippase family protein [Tenuifilaceae bacterium]